MWVTVLGSREEGQAKEGEAKMSNEKLQQIYFCKPGNERDPYSWYKSLKACLEDNGAAVELTVDLTVVGTRPVDDDEL